MASSIKTVLDMDISKFSSKAGEAVSIAGKTIGEGLKKTVEKKFGVKDALKGLFQGLGIGGVDAIASAVIAPFERGAEHARALAGLTADVYQNTLRWIGVVGGPTKELELQVKQVAELNRDIAMQRQLVAELNANPINFLTDGGRNAIRDAETGLNELIKKQAELSTTAQVTALQENRRTAALQRQGAHAETLARFELQRAAEGRKFEEKRVALLAEYNVLQKQGALPSVLQANRNALQAINAEEAIWKRNQREKVDDVYRAARAQQAAARLELRDASDLEKAQLRLKLLRVEYEVVRQRTGFLSPETFENRRAQLGAKNDIRLIQKKAREEQRSTFVEIGGSLAGGVRGRRSERERLADRGADFQRRAEDAVRTGQSPSTVARLARAASTDFAAVGGKVAGSVAEIGKADSAGLSAKLITANRHLKEISDNLKKVPLD